MVIFLCCEYAAESEPRGVGQIWEFQKFVNWEMIGRWTFRTMSAELEHTVAPYEKEKS